MKKRKHGKTTRAKGGSRYFHTDPPAATSVSNRSLVAATTTALAFFVPTAHGETAGESAPETGLAEITVTAQRRAETTQDIPYNITAINGDTVSNSGATTINDLVRVVPGLITVDSGPTVRGNNSNLTLRGLRTDAPGGQTSYPNGHASSVSTYYNETPVFFPLVLNDLERIEVLRGPQGTLYGSGSEGGTIRFITKSPDPKKFAAEVNVDGSKTQNSDGHLNGNINGVLNLPLADNLALRLNAGIEHLAGFIDDVALVQMQDGVPAPRVPGDLYSGFVTRPTKRAANSSDQSFERAALRWNATDKAVIDVSYLHQLTNVKDAQTSNPNWAGGDFDFSTGAPPSQASPNSANFFPAGGRYRNTESIRSPFRNTVDLVSLTATVDLGLATFSSASGAYRNRSVDALSSTNTFFAPGFTPDEPTLNALPYYRFFPRFTAYTSNPYQQKSFVEELRLVSSWDKPIDYVVGGYFERRLGSFTNDLFSPGINAFSSAVGEPSANPQYGDQLSTYVRKTAFTDRAVFSEVTYHVTKAWQVTAGGRLFWQRFTNNTDIAIFYCGAACSDDGVDPLGRSSIESASVVRSNIKKFNTSYDLGEQTKLYATYAEGFRYGGANGVSTAGTFATLPAYTTFEPDRAKSYEVGVKGTSSNRRFRYVADVYLIDLKNFQFEGLTAATYPVTFNGKKARSKGVELELESQLTQSVSTSLGYTYSDAKVSQSFELDDYALGGFTAGDPPGLLLAVSRGNRLPGVPHHSINAAVDFQTPLAMLGNGDLSLGLHLDASYRSREPGYIDPTSVFYWNIPSTILANARATLSGTQNWSVDVFINNIKNDPGFSGAFSSQAVQDPFATRTVARPRTVGVGLRYTF